MSEDLTHDGIPEGISKLYNGPFNEIPAGEDFFKLSVAAPKLLIQVSASMHDNSFYVTLAENNNADDVDIYKVESLDLVKTLLLAYTEGVCGTND